MPSKRSMSLACLTRRTFSPRIERRTRPLNSRGMRAARGLRVVIAGAGGAAHLAGVIAAHTWLPVLGVPIQSKLQGLDSLLSTAQMPGGIPVGTLAIGEAGAKNAALLAAAILGTSDEAIRRKLEAFRKKQTESVLAGEIAKVKTEILAATLGRRSGDRHPAGPCGLKALATTAAVELLRKGEVVALPTETVYGLAADALNPIAVAKIFEAKERPRFDPLIVHLPDEQWLERVAIVDNRLPRADRKTDRAILARTAHARFGPTTESFQTLSLPGSIQSLCE